MIFVNENTYDNGYYLSECLDMTFDRRTVLCACECGFESDDNRFEFIYMGF